jgi:predicted heme/steroid binding protein
VLALAEPKKFSIKDLEKYNGKNGKPAYIAHNGRVYDISNSGLWSGGEHMGLHQAGGDLTDELELAPHNKEVFERVKEIGILE